MSADTVDDLHAAEEMAGALADVLGRVLELIVEPLFDAFDGTNTGDRSETYRDARLALDRFARCNRPTCEYDDEAGWLCGDDCGCQADHEHAGHGDGFDFGTDDS